MYVRVLPRHYHETLLTTHPSTQINQTVLKLVQSSIEITQILTTKCVTSRQLKKAGCLTSLASNGVEALDNIRQLREDNNTMFDVILMGTWHIFGTCTCMYLIASSDCEMPVM